MAQAGNRRVVLGVTGGIAAYKSPDLVRRLRDQDIDVRVVMTRAATAFITPLSLQAVSGSAVHTDLLDPAAEAAMGHIELARWAELVLVAPATADFLARLTHGLADDLLATLCLATSAPVVAAPAMNRQMWDAPATRANVAVLQARGVTLIGPGDGSQACGEVGPGRMLEPAEIAVRVADLLAASATLAGLRVLVTAGPTREPLDPVRYVTNHSSGKMGYAVARAAAAAGARVTLISGPTALTGPSGVDRVDVGTAREMEAAVMSRIAECDVFIAAAAVADYAPVEYSAQKIKKEKGSLALALERTPDILAGVAALERRPFTVGFAAETQRVEENARAKLERKGLDMIAANRVGVDDGGFSVDTNALSVLWAEGGAELERASKTEIARRLVALVAERYRAQRRA